MKQSISRLAAWLRRRAENVAAALLATVFVTFILQIAFRYVFGWPVGWTLEVSTLAWTWLVLWGAAFVVPERDDIRFDILYSSVSDRTRRVFSVLTGLALVTIFAISLPAVVDYVTFMRVERVDYVGIRLDYAFSIYVVFAVAIMVRYLYRVWNAIRGRTPELTDPSHLRDE